VGEKRSSPRVTLVVVSVAGLAYAVMTSAIVPAIPTIQDDLHASENGVTFVLTGYLLAASVATAILGRLGDMLGKQRVLIWTLAVFTAGTLLGALSHSLTVLIVARVIQGAGGGIFPLSFGIIRDEFPPERVPGSIGFISAILGTGGAVGIVLGAIVVEHLGWEWVFWLTLPIALGATVAAWRLVPESPVVSPGRINWLAAALMSAGISLVLIGISRATAWGWGSARVLGLLAAGFVLCAVWVAVESRSAEPLIDMAMMRARGVWTANLVAFLLGAGLYSSFLIIPQFASFHLDASVVQAGLYLLPSTIGVVVLSSFAGQIARRFGSKSATVAGSAITGVAFGLLAVSQGKWQLLVASALMGIGIGLAFSALGNLIVEAVDPHQTGAAGGMNTVMRTIGGAFGGQLAATLIAAHTLANGDPALAGFADAFALAAGFLAVSTVAALLVPRRRTYATPSLEADSAQA
jgi:EmrB/QacA subfamily drug resistance transporter